MRGKRFSEEQIIGALKEAEAGMPIPDICRKYGIHQTTFYNWKAKYGGLSVSEARRLKALEDENRRLIDFPRSSYNYAAKHEVTQEEAVRKRLKELAQKRPRFGCPRLHIMLRREGIAINHKRAERIYGVNVIYTLTNQYRLL